MKLKRIALCALAALLVAAMIGCSSMSIEDIIAKAAAANSAIKNMEADISMDFVMSSNGEDMPIGMSGSAVMHEDPLKMKMTMELSMPGLDAPMNTDVYGVTEGNNFVTYTSMQGQWFKQVMPFGELGQMGQANGKANMELYLSSAQNFKLEGDDTINGVMCSKITGVLTGEAMRKAVMSSGAMDSMAQGGVTASMFDGLGDLPVTIWVDKESFVPVKYIMDMTQLMNGLMGKMSEGSGEAIAVKACVMSMTYKNVNGAPDVVLPPEAASAMELPGI